MPSACQSCGANVVFVASAKTGRSMILDAKPTKGVVMVGIQSGTLCLEPASGADHQAARVVDVYTDHHATCVRAADWQGRTRRNPPVRSLVPGALDA